MKETFKEKLGRTRWENGRWKGGKESRCPEPGD